MHTRKQQEQKQHHRKGLGEDDRPLFHPWLPAGGREQEQDEADRDFVRQALGLTPDEPILLVLPGCDTGPQPIEYGKDIIRQLIKSLGEPIPIKGQVVYATASFGISMFPTDGSDGKALLLAADQAMYAAKSNGRNGFQYFTSSLQIKDRKSVV